MRSVATSMLLALALAAPSAAAPGAPGARRGGPMPDSVLAWIGSRREVSLAAFRDAWRQVAPPARPDTLTPQAARRFLDLLAGREALGELALRDPPAWTAGDSARYRGLADQLTMRAALDSALAATRAALAAAGDTTRSPGGVGLAARDRLLAALAPRWSEQALERVAAAFRSLPAPTADSGVAAQIHALGLNPALPPEEAGRALVETAAGPFTGGELMDWWARLDPVRRPRVRTADQVRDLVANALFERALRRAAAGGALARRPDIAAALARQREAIAVEHRLAREVSARIATDSLALLGWYRRDPERFALPPRALVLRLVLDDRASAEAMARSVRGEAAAESLIARARRRGVRYDETLVAARDPALFERVTRAGPGAVLGPDSTADGWQVVRVRALMGARTRSFDEARAEVEGDWYGHEAERLTAELLARCRRAVPVRVNERALARLTSP